MSDPPVAPEPADTETIWLQRIAAARRRGDHLQTYDVAVRALRQWPGQLVFEHQAILALARAGALTNARARYDRLAADGALAAITDARLAEDFAALDGRLWKDFANRRPPAEAQHGRLRSAEAYAGAYRRFGGFYPAINAASMYLAAGRRDAAPEYAAAALALARVAPADDYWAVATVAEALLILGDPAGAEAALRIAAVLGAGRLDDVASTRQQLAWVAELAGAPPETLRPLVRPRVLSWTSGRAAAPEPFDGDQPVLAFGAILCAADIALAEALLAAGAEIDLVLPCDPALITTSPICATAGLADRFRAVLQAATTIMVVTREGGPFEPGARLLCQQQAHGLAALRARHLGVTAERLGPATQAEPPLEGAHPADLVRQPHAILFGDVRGFSQLSEADQLLFITHIIGGFAAALDARPAVEYAETAGDGLFVVLSDIVEAVGCCFALHDVVRPPRIAAAGLPAHLALRLSAHIGPLHKRYDGVIHRDRFCGMEVIRTARIEPVTPVGEVFVTEQFAAALAGATGDRYVCEYAGIQPMAKGFGECRMYSLRPVMLEA